MANRVNFKRAESIIKRLILHNRDFEVDYTNNSMRIKENSGRRKKYIAGNSIPMEGIVLMSRLKKHCLSLGIPKTNHNKESVKYFAWSRKISYPGIYMDVCEIDVNKAYLNIAYNLGYIDKDLFELAMNVKNKKSRLALLGSLATQKKTRVYKNGKLKETKRHYESEESKILSSYYYHIAHELGYIMDDIFKGYEDDVFFYWTDAFFISKKAKPGILENVEKFGLSAKTIDLDYISISPEKDCMKVECKVTGGNKKVFRKAANPAKKAIVEAENIYKSFFSTPNT